MENILVINVIPSGVGGIQTYGKTLEEKLKEAGISIKRIETYKVDGKNNFFIESAKKSIRIFTNLIKLFKIVQQNRDKKIILHAHIAKYISFWENSLYAIFVNFLGVPYIFHIHSSLLHLEYLNSNWLGKAFRRYILGKCSRIIALSNYWKGKLLEIEGIPEDKFIVIYNFVDTEKFTHYKQQDCKKMLKLPENKKIIFSIGRLVERKGYQYLIEAIPDIIKNRKDVLFFIGGKGPIKEKLEEKIQNMGIDEYVKLIGFIPDEILPLWMNACDVYVLPSLRETFPIVMLEALASGKPVVGTKIGAIPEIIGEEYGLLVEPANPKDLAEKILIALEREWNEKKIKKYAEQFTWERIKEGLIEVYKEIS